jgi:hypothetical protein
MNDNVELRPNWLELATCWMETGFKGRQAIVFFHPDEPMERLRRISERFSIHPSKLFHCEFYVHLTDDPEAVNVVRSLNQDSFGFVMLWDGRAFSTENT